MTAFELLNAPANPSPAHVWVAIFCAERLILAVPLALAALWLWGDLGKKRAALAATAAGLCALAVAQLLALHYIPRPFAAGVGHTFLAHVADSSFPSDHATLMAAVAASLLFVPETRAWGWVLAALWVPMAWARIYVGVHYPSDVVGGAAAGVGTALLLRCYAEYLVCVLAARLVWVYSVVLAPLIARGWVR